MNTEKLIILDSRSAGCTNLTASSSCFLRVFVPSWFPRSQKLRPRRRGMATLMAMIFLAIFATLSVAMYGVSTLNTTTAHNLADAQRARSVAESGLRWAAWRFVQMNRPRTPLGVITASVANNLWPNIRSAFTADLATMATASERVTTFDGTTLKTASIAGDNAGGSFIVTIRQHPLYTGDTLDARTLRVTSTGTYRGASKSISMDFYIDKKVKFAVIGKVEIQLGKNTLVEGNVAMGTPNKFPPYISLSDFKHLTTRLDTQVTNFETYLKTNHTGYDGRIAASNSTEWKAAVKAGYTDVNQDGYIDEYDLYVKEFDKNGDNTITASEFTNSSTRASYDGSLFAAIDNLGGPLTSDDPTRAGYQDAQLSNNDGYAKIRGRVLLADTADSWAANLKSSGMTINDMFAGPIIPPTPLTPPVQFGVTPAELFDLAPTNFDTSYFANKSGTNAGATVISGDKLSIKNKTLATTDANGGTLTETTPFGSTTYQATYTRPVFKNMTFENVTIPLGMNALFQNCKFKGTTFVKMTKTITNTSGSATTSASDGMTWAQRMIPVKGKTPAFSSTTALTAANSYGFQQGNNLRFDACTINGPIANDVPTAYTHFSNSWEFTGNTMFDLSGLPVDQQTATIVAPQTNIEMGSYNDPGHTPSTLVGVVVAGNIDVRGMTLIDGSLIVTGDGAGNTTLGWFGNNDANTDPNAIPAEGWGKLNIRYNPNRALPDGINVPVDILATPSTYAEGT